MKDYKDVARSVFRRRDVYLQEKKRKREVFMKRSAVALSCCLMMLVGFNIWRTDSLKTIAPSPDKSQFNVTEANTTAPPTTDENGMTGIPVTTTAAITTAHSDNGSKPVNGTTAEAVPEDTAHAVTTTRINNSGTANRPTPTTDSFMAVTVTRRTSAATTTSNRTSTVRTAATSSGHNGTTPTTHRTTTSPRITTASRTTAADSATTRRTTSKPDTTTTRRTTSRPYTTTAIHTTTRSYTSTGAVHSTTREDIPIIATTARRTTTAARTTTMRFTTTVIYTTMTSPQPANTDQPYNPAQPVYTTKVAGTTGPTSSTTTSLASFHYNGNYYKTTGTRIEKDILNGHYIGREYDANLNRIFYIYAYPNPNIDPEFMCCCYMDGDYAYVGINETWQPETLGDLLDGINSDYNLIFSAFYDTSAGQVRSISDSYAASELLSGYRGKKLEITGTSYNAACEAARKDRRLSPELDLSNKLGYIYVKTPYLSNECSYLQQGYIHITDDGKLEVDLLYLKYAIDIGREDADELIKKLRTI